MNRNSKQTIDTTHPIYNWLDIVINQLAADQEQIKLGTAPPEKIEFYKNLSESNYQKLALDNYVNINNVVVSDAILSFLQKLSKKEVVEKLSVLGGNNIDKNISFWVELKEYDFDFICDLTNKMSEVNSVFGKFGVNIDLEIVDSEDQYIMPEYFHNIKLH